MLDLLRFSNETQILIFLQIFMLGKYFKKGCFGNLGSSLYSCFTSSLHSQIGLVLVPYPTLSYHLGPKYMPNIETCIKLIHD